MEGMECLENMEGLGILAGLTPDRLNEWMVIGMDGATTSSSPAADGTPGAAVPNTSRDKTRLVGNVVNEGDSDFPTNTTQSENAKSALAKPAQDNHNKGRKSVPEASHGEYQDATLENGQNGEVAPGSQTQAANLDEALASDLQTLFPSIDGNHVPLQSISPIDSEMSTPGLSVEQRAFVQAQSPRNQQVPSQIMQFEDGKSPAGDSALGSSLASPDSQKPAYATPVPVPPPANTAPAAIPLQQTPERCYDWIVAKCSFHYVRDFEAFVPGSYIGWAPEEIPVTVQDGLGNSHIVRGCGAVILEVQAPPVAAFPGVNRTASVRLDGVLWMPYAICNVLNPVTSSLKARPKEDNCRVWIHNNQVPLFVTKELWGLERIEFPRGAMSSSMIDPAYRQIGSLDWLRKRVAMYIDGYNFHLLSSKVQLPGNASIPWVSAATLSSIDYNCFPSG